MPLPLAAGAMTVGRVGLGILKAAGRWAWNHGPEVVALHRLLDNIVPTYENLTTVRIWGNPESKRSDLYRLALSIAFGMVRRRQNPALALLVSPVAGIQLTWAAHEKYLEVQVRWKYSGFVNLITQLDPTFAESSLRFASIYAGPPDTVLGGRAEFGNVASLVLPSLPSPIQFNQTILTDRMIYQEPDGNRYSAINPAPPGDKISRGYLEGLMYNFLTAPRENELIKHSDLFLTAVNAAVTPGAAAAPFPPNTAIPSAVQGRDHWDAFWRLTRGTSIANYNNPSPPEKGP